MFGVALAGLKFLETRREWVARRGQVDQPPAGRQVVTWAALQANICASEANYTTIEGRLKPAANSEKSPQRLVEASRCQPTRAYRVTSGKKKANGVSVGTLASASP